MSKAKFGLLISQSGPTGLWAPSSINSAVLAAAEANAAEGIFGSEVELLIRDAGWASESAVTAAQDMVDNGASAIVGMMASNSRRGVSFALAGKVPFIYTPNFEMDTPEPTIATGSTDDLLIEPFLEWIEQNLGARRFFIVGSDYRWPRRTMPMCAKMITSRAGQVVGMMARPIGTEDTWDDHAVETIKQANPDVVIVFLVGDQSIPFYRAFARAGLSKMIPRCAIATDESVLCALSQNESDGLYACANYFASARTTPNCGFMERYWSTFGEYAPIPNAYGQSCYEGLNFAFALAKAATCGSAQPLLTLPPRKVSFKSARFDTKDANLGTRKPVLVAQAKGMCFDVLARL
ncbi:substrate-binding domain-containing protein [Sulfitobacter sp. NFXS29]|uniref:substrate-binding domain-containing protein n=1 Tax=Sulfitobacter sp. NFXS29 TaxID=2818438 RepID=UPI0032DECD44